MAQWAKTLAARPNDLSSILGFVPSSPGRNPSSSSVFPPKTGKKEVEAHFLKRTLGARDN